MNKSYRYLSCYLTVDKDAIELTDNYWSKTDDGNYKFRVKELESDFGEALFTIKKHSITVDLNRRCCYCSRPRPVTSRSVALSSPLKDLSRKTADYLRQESRSLYYRNKFKYVCDECSQIIDACMERRAYESMKAELQHIYVTADNARIDYVNISARMHICTLLFFLGADSHETKASEVIEFSLNTVMAHLGPARLVEKLLGELVSVGILAVSPKNEMSHFMYNYDGYLVVQPEKYREVVWRFTKSEEGSDLPSVLLQSINEYHDTKRSEYSAAMAELWNEFAFHECEEHLMELLEKYKFNFHPGGVKTKEAIKHALSYYSIAQVWKILWQCVRMIAVEHKQSAVSTRPQTRLSALLIGKVEHAVSQGWTITPYLYRAECRCTLLGYIFHHYLSDTALSSDSEFTEMTLYSCNASEIHSLLLNESTRPATELSGIVDPLEQRDVFEAAFDRVLGVGLKVNATGLDSVLIVTGIYWDNMLHTYKLRLSKEWSNAEYIEKLLTDVTPL